MTDKNLPSVEYLHKRLSYDPDTGKLFWKHNGKSSQWNGRWAGKEAFTCILKNGYAMGRIDGDAFYAHRIIMAMENGFWPPEQVDHINGKRSDNRVQNLRLATQRQNSRNSAKPSHNTSGFLGVSWDKRSKKWEAHIGIYADEYVSKAGTVKRSKKVSLGMFSDINEAAAARKKAENDLGFSCRHGDDSRYQK